MAQRSRRGGRIIIYVALILILLVALGYLFLNGKLNLNSGFANQPTAIPPVATPQPMVDIVVTTQAVSRGTVFTADVLTTIKYPKEYDTGTFFTSIAEVTGKIAKIDLEAHVPLTASLVVENGTLNSQQIPAGMVAISIPLKDRVSAISYAPQAGDHLNILAAMTFVDLDTAFQTVLPNNVGSIVAPSAGTTTGTVGDQLTANVTTGSTAADGTPCNNANNRDQQPNCPDTQGSAILDPSLQQPLYVYPSESQRPRLVSQTLVQDAIVLGVGNFITPAQQAQAAIPTATPLPDATAVPTTPVIVYPDTITVIVTPQDAVTLNYLIYSGAELTLVLRGNGDSQRIQTEAVTLQYLMDQYNIPLPAKLPYGTEPRTDMATPIAPLQLDPRYNIPTAP